MASETRRSSGKLKKKKDSQSEEQNNLWERDLLEAQISDDSWRCLICLFTESLVIYHGYIEHFIEGAKTRARRRVRAITPHHILQKVKQANVNRQQKNKEKVKLSPQPEIYKEANKMKNLETSMMAKLIKYEILQLKAEALLQKEMDLKTNEEKLKEMREIVPGSCQDIYGGVNKAQKKEDQKKKTENEGKKKGKDTKQKNKNQKPNTDKEEGVRNILTKKKYRTSLLNREESYLLYPEIEDYPVNSYDFYIALCHFSDYQLPIELFKIGVPLSAIVKVYCPNPKEIITKRDDDAKSVESFQALNIQKYSIDLMYFWEQIQNEYNTLTNIELFKNCALMNFQGEPFIGDIFYVMPEEPDPIIYEKFSHALYDIGDFKRWHKNYFRHMKIFKVLEVDKAIPLGSVYLSQVESIPMESSNIESILNAMLDQVEENVKQISSQLIEYEEEKEKEEISKQIQVQQIVEQRFKLLNELYGIDEQSINSSESINEPVAILHHDTALFRTWHFDKSNNMISWLMVFTLALMPWSHLWRHIPPPTSGQKAKNKWHLNRIQSYLSRDDTDNIFIHIMQILIAYKLQCPLSDPIPENSNQSPVYPKGNGFCWPGIKTSPRRPWLIPGKLPGARNSNMMADSPIDPLNALFELPEFSNIEIFKEKMKAKYPEYIEELTSTSLLQFLKKCWQKYNCAHYYYFPLTDSVLLKMHMGVNKKGFYRDSWAEYIPTVLHFADFFDYILEDEYSWLQEQERIYDKQIEIARKQEMDERLARQIDLEMASQMDKNAGDISFVDDDLISKGSIKDMIRKRKLMEMELNNKENKNEKSSISETSQKNNKETNISENIMKTSNERIFGIEVAADDEPFYKIGFDIGSNRIQMNGRFFDYFSPDGCKIRVESRKWIRAQFEDIHLSINKSDNILYLNMFLKNQSVEMHFPISFNLETKEGIRLGFSQRDLEQEEKVEEEEEWTIYEEEIESENKKPFTLYYDFRMSWPTGLFLQVNPSLKDEIFMDPITISQRYLPRPMSPHLNSIRDESWRVYTRSGIVYRFMQDSSVQILCSNGTIFNCKTFYYDSNLKEMFLKSFKEPELKSQEIINTVKEQEQKGFFDSIKTRPYHSMPDLPPVSPKSKKMNRQRVDKYNVIEPDGLTYEKRRDDIVSPIKKLLMKKSTDFQINEQFIRRGDGTDIRLWGDNNSLLEVTYPDGTRITSWYTIEDFEICIDTSSEEESFIYYKPDESFQECSDSGFVCVTYHCRIEHPCFAGVYFNGSDFSTEIFAHPSHNLRVHLPSNLNFIQIDLDEFNLKVSSEEILYTHFACSADHKEPGLTTNNSNINCETRIYLNALQPPIDAILCENRDSSEQIFQLSSDGTFSTMKSEDCREATEYESNFEKRKIFNEPRFQYIIMNRNLSGVTFFTDKEVMDHIQKLWNLKEVVILESEESVLTLKPIVEDWSHSWLIPYQSNKKINIARESSYCMHLFAPQARRSKNRPSSVASSELTPRPPHIFLARIYTIVDPFSFQDVLDAIDHFFSEGLLQMERLKGHKLQKSQSEAALLARQLREAILGQGSWNLLTLYSEAVRMPRPGYRPPVIAQPCGSTRIKRFLMQRAQNRELEEWYRESLRRHAVPPYFKSIPGSTFLSVIKMISNAMEESEKRHESIMSSTLAELTNLEQEGRFVIIPLEVLTDHITNNCEPDCISEEHQFFQIVEMLNTYLNMLLSRFMDNSEIKSNTDNLSSSNYNYEIGSDL